MNMTYRIRYINGLVQHDGSNIDPTGAPAINPEDFGGVHDDQSFVFCDVFCVVCLLIFLIHGLASIRPIIKFELTWLTWLDLCLILSRIFLSSRNTCDQPHMLVWFVLIRFIFSKVCFIDGYEYICDLSRSVWPRLISSAGIVHSVTF